MKKRNEGRIGRTGMRVRLITDVGITIIIRIGVKISRKKKR